MLRPFQSQSFYMLALRPFAHHIGTITASNRNLSMTAYKHLSGGVQPKIPEGKQDPNQHEPKIDPRLKARQGRESNKEHQGLDGWWLKYSREREQKQKQKLQRKSAEIQNLTVALVREKSERLKVEEHMQIYMVIEDKLMDSKFKRMVPYGMNKKEGLKELIEQPEFAMIVDEEAQSRGLLFVDVADCVKSLDHVLLPSGSNREETVVIRDMDFTAKERAALIAIMKLQSEWSSSFSWREVVSGKAGEGNAQGC